MRFQALLQYLDNYFNGHFDFDTIQHPTNDPYVHISQVKTSPKPMSEGYGFYLTAPHYTPIYPELLRMSIIAVNALTGKYLLQKDHSVEFTDTYGCCNSFTTPDYIYICAVITNTDDARFICKSVLSQIKIFLANEDF